MIPDILEDLEAIRDELTEDAEPAIKAGRRNSTSDQAQIDAGYKLAMQLCDLFESLGADTGEEEGEEEMGMEEEMGEMEGKAERFGGEKRSALEDSDFVDTERRSFPIKTAQDVKDAVSSWGRYKGTMTFDQFKARLTAIAKRRGFESALPAEWKNETKKSLDEDYVLIGGAVKMAADDSVFGPAVWLNGSPDTPDLSHMRDYFTKSTDFWIDEWERRPMLWHHNLDESDILDAMRKDGAGDDEIKAMREALDYLDEHPVIGTWTKATVDPIAVWLKGQINKAHRYRGAVKQLIDSGLIKISTDSAPHLVKRQRQPNGTHEVKRWPIVAGSLTATAAEPRLFDVQAVKALYDAAGVQPPFAIYDNPEAQDADAARSDATKAADDDRARRLLLLELELLAMEATIT